MMLRRISALLFYVVVIFVLNACFAMKDEPQSYSSTYQSSHQVIATLSSEGS